jgi:hypothetical protein
MALLCWQNTRQRSFTVCLFAWNTAKPLSCAFHPGTRQKCIWRNLDLTAAPRQMVFAVCIQPGNMANIQTFVVCISSRNTVKAFLYHVPHHETSTAKKRHSEDTARPIPSPSLSCATDEGTRQRLPSLLCATKEGSTTKVIWPDQMVARKHRLLPHVLFAV